MPQCPIANHLHSLAPHNKIGPTEYKGKHAQICISMYVSVSMYMVCVCIYVYVWAHMYIGISIHIF